MKKYALALIVAVPVIAYPIASWLIGGQVEAFFDQQYAQLDGNAPYKVVERKTQRGIFSSEEVVTVELKPKYIEWFRGFSGDESEQPPAEPVRLSFRTHINHGPIPAFSGFGLATAHSELELNNPLIAKLYAGKPPLTSDTVVDFWGTSHDRMRSPAVDSVLDNNMRISWGELVLNTSYNRDMTKWDYQGELPFLKLSNEDGSRSLEMNALAIEGHQIRVFAENQDLYTGPVKYSVQRLDAKGLCNIESCDGNPCAPLMQFEGLSVQANATENAGFIDIMLGFMAEKMHFDGEMYRDVKADIALRHLEAKALAELYKFLSQDDDLEGETNPSKRFFPVFATLLENSPEIVIERMGMSTPQGDIKASALVKLPNAKVGNLESAAENPLLLMSLATVLQADAQIALPEVLLKENLTAEQTEMLGAMIQSGYVLNKSGQLSTALSYAQGNMTINGQPLNPAMMGMQ